MRRSLRHLAAPVLLAWLVAACGGDTATPTPPPPVPVIGDTLLMGPSTAAALSAIITKRGTAVPAAEIQDGVIRTRLQAVVRPDAPVGEVNAALLAAGARIEGSQAGHPFLTLRIPAVATRQAAEALGAALVTSGAFWIAIPTFETSIAEIRVLPASGDTGVSHLIPGRLPAAWNVQALATSPIRVLLPDHYHQLTPLAPVSPLLFTASPAGRPSPKENHGFHVAGILAADHDGTPFTGAFPHAGRITVEGIPVGGLGGGTTIAELVAKFPATGQFLLSTSLGNDFDNSAADRLWFVTEALNWRIAVAPHVGRFLHLTAAGNEGKLATPINQAFWGSRWNVAGSQDDLRLLIRGIGLAAADSAGFDNYWAWMLANAPAAATRSPNLIMVGSSSRSGQESDFSSHGSDLRTVGELVFAPCVIQDANYPANQNRCNGTSARYSGTSMATPLVAGIAAYLWSLDPSLSPQALKTRLQEAYARSGVPGVLDAYWAVLRLDAGLGNAPVRRELLDVAAGPGTPGRDGRFDEHDLNVFTQAFAAYHGQRLSAGTPDATDHSRFDLNGDGLTGDTTRREAFDLNADGQIGALQHTVEGATQTFNELFLSDLRILCYYAYSALYQGGAQARRDALPHCVPPEEPPQLPEPGIGHLESRLYRMSMAQSTVDVPGTGDCFLEQFSGQTPLPFAWSRNATCSFPQGSATVSMDLKDDGRGKGSVSVAGDGQYQGSSGLWAVVNTTAHVKTWQSFVIVRPGVSAGTADSIQVRIKVKLVASTTGPHGIHEAILVMDSQWGTRKWEAKQSMTIEEEVTVPFNFAYGVPATPIGANMFAQSATVVSTVDHPVAAGRASVAYEVTLLGLPADAVVLGSDGKPWGAPSSSPPQGAGPAPSAMKR
ncbi:MAG: S8 family serine peptidase [Gemmatimonadales bacterium]